MRTRAVVVLVALALATSSSAYAQSASSNKAFFASSQTGVTFAPVNGGGYSAPVTLFSIPAALKTSNGGAVSATVSLEAALWTDNITTALVNGGKSSSSSRAALKVWVELDGVPMDPGVVVYADRLQATGVTLNLTCNAGTISCVVNGDLTLELFQATKNANSFTFFLGPLPATVHQLAVKAQALIECRSNGVVSACPTGILDGYTDASTQAAIGKATIMIEEQQNWGKQ